MTYAPKYTTLSAVKAYGKTKGADSGEDAVLSDAIARAESTIDDLTGASLQQATYTLEPAASAFVDANSWLRVQVKNPIQSVSVVELMDQQAGAVAYSALVPVTLEIHNSTAASPNEAPNSESYWFDLYASGLSPRAPGGLRVRVTYVGGFTTIPDVVRSVVNRAAWWFYKLREAPMGRVANLMTQVSETPLDLPPDVKAQVEGWRRLVA